MVGHQAGTRHRSYEAVIGWNGFTRLAIITIGGILVLQSSDELDLAKLVYLTLAAAAVVFAVLSLRRLRATESFRATRPLIFASVGLLAVVGLSLPIALSNGVAPTAWLRDAASYGLFALVAFVALDAHEHAKTRWILALALVVGALATVSYTLGWLELRGLLTLPVQRLVLPSGGLASMFFVIACSYSFRGERHRLLWALAAGLTLGLFLIIGTRGRLPFALLPVILGLWATRNFRANLPPWAVQFGAAAGVVLAVLVLQEVTTPTTTPPVQRPNTVLERRITSVDDLVTNPGGDPSMRERVSQTIGAWNVFIEHPIVGAGPGLEVAWADYAGEPQRGYTLDSPVMLLSKFGLVGLGVGMAWVVAFAGFVRRAYERIRSTPESLVLVGQVVVLLYATLFSPPMQDKGVSFALMIVLALVLTRAAGTTPAHSPSVTAEPGPP